MPTFRITSPDGAIYQVDVPDGATEQDALAKVQAEHTAVASTRASSDIGLNGGSSTGAKLESADALNSLPTTDETQPTQSQSPDEPQTTAGGAALHHFERGVAPAAGGFAAAVPAAGAGVALGALTGPAAPIASPILGFAGGMAGFFGGQKLTSAIQDKVLEYLPDSVKEALGQDEATRAAEEKQHPIASFVGDLAPNFLTMRPGAIEKAAENAPRIAKLMSNPYVARGAGAAFMGGQEAATEAYNGEELDPTKIAISAGSGALMNKETALGRKLASAPQYLIPKSMRTPVAPPPEDVADTVMASDSVDSAIASASDIAKTPVEPSAPSVPKETWEQLYNSRDEHIGWINPDTGARRPLEQPTPSPYTPLGELDAARSTNPDVYNGEYQPQAPITPQVPPALGELDRARTANPDAYAGEYRPQPIPQAEPQAPDLGALDQARAANPALFDGERVIRPPIDRGPVVVRGAEPQPAQQLPLEGLAAEVGNFRAAQVAKLHPDLQPYGYDVVAARAPMPKEPSLFNAIAELGGIKPDGDVLQLLQGYKGDKGANGLPARSKIINKDGLPPDDMRRALQERGWFGGMEDQFGPNASEAGSYRGDNLGELYTLIDNEARGQKVYKPESAIHEQLAYRQMLDDDMARAGVKASDSVPVAAEKLKAYRGETDIAAEYERQGHEAIDDMSPEARNIAEENGYEPGSDIGAEFEAPRDEYQGARGATEATGLTAERPQEGAREPETVQSGGVPNAAEGAAVGELGRTPTPIDFEQYAAQNGASRQDFGDAGLHKSSKNVSGAAKRSALANQQSKDVDLANRREGLRIEYDAAVSRGEIRPKSNIERMVETANGFPEKEATQAARRVLEKRGISWEQAEPNRPYEQARAAGTEASDAAALKVIADRKRLEEARQLPRSNSGKVQKPNDQGLFAPPPEKTLFQKPSETKAANDNPTVHETMADLHAAIADSSGMTEATRTAKADAAIFSRDWHIGGDGSTHIILNENFDHVAEVKKLKNGGYSLSVLGQVIPERFKDYADAVAWVLGNDDRALFRRGEGEARVQSGDQDRLGDGLLGKSPEHISDAEGRTIDAVNEIAQRIVPSAEIRMAKELRAEPGDASQAAGDTVYGATYRDGVKRLIAWSLESPDEAGTMRHEAVHWLKRGGFISKEEWMALSQSAEARGWLKKHGIEDRYSDLDHQGRLEEAIAEEYSAWARGQSKATPFIRRVFNNIKELLGQIGGKIRETFGKDATAEDVFRRIERGEVGGRGERDGMDGGKTAFQTPKEGEQAKRWYVNDDGTVEQRLAPLRAYLDEGGNIIRKTAPPSVPVETGPRPRRAEMVEGTAEWKNRGTSLSIEARAIENHLVNTLGNLPEYRAANFKQEFKDTAVFVAGDYDRAVAAAMGDKPIPSGVRTGMLLNAVEREATARGDTQTVLALATKSKLLPEITEKARDIAALGYGHDGLSAVDAIKSVQDARAEKLKAMGTDVPKQTRSFVSEASSQIKAESQRVRKMTPRQTWDNVLNAMLCPY